MSTSAVRPAHGLLYGKEPRVALDVPGVPSSLWGVRPPPFRAEGGASLVYGSGPWMCSLSEY